MESSNFVSYFIKTSNSGMEKWIAIDVSKIH